LDALREIARRGDDLPWCLLSPGADVACMPRHARFAAGLAPDEVVCCVDPREGAGAYRISQRAWIGSRPIDVDARARPAPGGLAVDMAAPHACCAFAYALRFDLGMRVRRSESAPRAFRLCAAYAVGQPPPGVGLCRVDAAEDGEDGGDGGREEAAAAADAVSVEVTLCPPHAADALFLVPRVRIHVKCAGSSPIDMHLGAVSSEQKRNAATGEARAALRDLPAHARVASVSMGEGCELAAPLAERAACETLRGLGARSGGGRWWRAAPGGGAHAEAALLMEAGARHARPPASFYPRLGSAGEDAFVCSFFASRGGCCGRFYVDAGCGDGARGSSTIGLALQFGWRGVGIDCQPDMVEQFVASRGFASGEVACLGADGIGGATIHIPADPALRRFAGADERARRFPGGESRSVLMRTTQLRAVLSSAKCPPLVDFLSVTCEGMDADVLKGAGFSERRFELVAVYHGQKSDKAREQTELMHKAGYRKVHSLAWMHFFEPS
jgi:hypothetical protein